MQSQAYRQQYGFNSIFLLPVNLYGPGDNFDPETLARDPGPDQEVRGRRGGGRDEIVVWGTGSATREFLYVEDAAEAIVLAAERYDGAEPVNLGAGQEISIRDLVELIAQAHRLQRPRRLGRLQARRAAAPDARHLARREAASASSPRRRSRRGCAGPSSGIRTVAELRPSLRTGRPR